MFTKRKLDNLSGAIEGIIELMRANELHSDKCFGNKITTPINFMFPLTLPKCDCWVFRPRELPSNKLYGEE